MVFDQFKQHLPDIDPGETQEWLEALESVVRTSGSQRAQFLLYKVLKQARLLNVGLPQTVTTRPINTISPEQEPWFPGDEDMERRIRRLIRWNAAVMVTRANERNPGLGGHISTYASSASLYEVGFNHFFRGKDWPGGIGDAVYVQGHGAPGIYARAFLEGRLQESHLEHFRMESKGGGLSSYPHPRLMPEFWEYPTVSMGLGPINAVYHARFLRYLHNRGLADTSDARVWCFLGDGETDEPESLAALTLASREGLDNLVFVINCNLQRLDGPVRGNGQIVQELEARFRGSGWNVVKVLLGREWDDLLARDPEGLLVERMRNVLDGDWQRMAVEGGATIREEFFGTDPRLKKIVEHLSDEQLERLRMGGHDYRKLYSAYWYATEHQHEPTVILARTVKGWTLGEGFEARNVTHQMKKLGQDELKVFRDRLELPISDEQIENAPYYHPGDDSPEVQYMHDHRRNLGGLLPERRQRNWRVELPADDLYAEFRKGTGPKVPVSTTMAFVRLLRALMKDDDLGDRIVPIIPDEARTFGMESLFREFKIYAAEGQQYKPVDWNVLLSYTEGQDGQILEEGITEAGSMASFTAAATSYATTGEPMIPFYIFYSMFGFQRVGDSIWSLADSRGRGFLLGATYGRTTLNGEGLQHQDGHTLLTATTVPNCLAYDPAFHYETATIVRDGLRRMYQDGEDVFYYLTLYNENYEMPDMPEGVEEGILKGLYRFRPSPLEDGDAPRAHLLGSGVILQQVMEAQRILAEDYGVAATVWSAPSFSELRRDALTVERSNRMVPDGEARVPYVTGCFADESRDVPVVAATDSMKAVADQVSRWIPLPFTALGTDGFGRSDTRENLRHFFENDAAHVVYATLVELARLDRLPLEVALKARERFGIDPDRPDPAHTDEVRPQDTASPNGGARKKKTSGSKRGKRRTTSKG
jgi:pyruvate dehydrogenase E1 component